MILGAKTRQKDTLLRLFSACIAISILTLLASCQRNALPTHVNGIAQGSAFNITIYGLDDDSLTYRIGACLSNNNQLASAWDSQSTLSRLNAGDSVYVAQDFVELAQISRMIHSLSNGYMSPTLNPLIEAWGFGSGLGYLNMSDSLAVQQLMRQVNDARSWCPEKPGLWAWPEGMSLSFTSVAQGHSVDLISERLMAMGATAAIVEIGGEVRCFGRKPNGKDFKVGIEKPLEQKSKDLQEIIPLRDRALATSGDYRNVKKDVVTGERYAHTIDAFTGWPARSNMLSATLIGPTCAEADGMATAAMAMGPVKTKTWLAANPLWDAYLIFLAGDGTLTTWSSY